MEGGRERERERERGGGDGVFHTMYSYSILFYSNADFIVMITLSPDSAALWGDSVHHVVMYPDAGVDRSLMPLNVSCLRSD